MPASVEREVLDRLLGTRGAHQRYTQDSPILPEVWIAFAREPDGRFGLLLTPHRERRAVELAIVLRERLGRGAARARVAATNTYVVADLTFPQLIQALLPLSEWGDRVIGGGDVPRIGSQEDWRGRTDLMPVEVWLSFVVDLIASRMAKPTTGAALVNAAKKAHPDDATLVFRVASDRPARQAVSRSAGAIKADAARLLFAPSCRKLRWAIVDSGVDASHPAFRRRDDDGVVFPEPFAQVQAKPRRLATRVAAAFDFTKVRPALAKQTGERRRQTAADAQRRLRAGLSIDWDAIGDEIEIPLADGYEPPANPHGTHVAGILAADWRESDDTDATEDIVGVCPDIELVDLRVFGEEGAGDEFDILAALQFIRHLNSRSEQPYIHGVNLSLSLDHKVHNYACGRTPICEEVERLIGTGVVAVAAAGNEGWVKQFDHDGVEDFGYRAISITDPGNADRVITVGATHRYSPHSYGVSFFSSRGPTGDGRAKPDLVAPGEKITSTTPRRAQAEMDGTSQAAPHVSGAAALLMARHDELVGDPVAIKELLCRTATDLGRERYFQGAGMLDVLRAMQAH